MGRADKYFGTAFAALMASSLVMAQVAFPPFVVQGETWTNGTHHVAVTQKILAPGSDAQPLAISGTADAELKSGTEVRLAEGFHAGGFTGTGQLHAWIDQGPRGPDDVITIAPDPATQVIDNVLHVNKWEKLEIGLQLPQAYQAAIDSFFIHYYPNAPQDYTADPGNTDPYHDLNPYADDSLQLVMTLTSPSGTQSLRWGFYMKEATWASADPTAVLTEDPNDSLYAYHIRFRIAPDEEGAWQFNLSIKALHTATTSDTPLDDLLYTGYGFICDPPLEDNHGFLHVNTANRRTLQFDDSTSFFGLGTDMADTYHNYFQPDSLLQHGRSYFRLDEDDMQRTMGQLHSVGGNFLRMFLMDKLFSPEYVNLGVYDHYHAMACANDFEGSCQYQCWAFDRMLDHARDNDIYIQLCIDPYPPILDYQSLGWDANPYWLQFVRPTPQAPPLNPYDMKRFFFTNGDPDSTGSGVFYYWKRKYKYIMSRWGWSVNIAAIEPFNETDQLLSYKDVNITGNCTGFNGHWTADPGLPGIVNDWVTDITDYMRQPVDLSHPATSTLGYSNKLFLMSYTPAFPASDTAQLLPFTNPNVDLIDIHHGLQSREDLRNYFDQDQDFRDNYLSNGQKKPFHNGEFNYYSFIDVPFQPNDYETPKIFDNYDVSFHNEIWASTFFGNFAAGTTWEWERVFWWPYGMKLPPQETQLQNPLGFIHTNVLDAFNTLNPNYNQVQVQNRPVYHNFKPLSDLLSNVDWQSYQFFDDAFDAHKVYDDAGGIEAYYLTSASQPLAIGWVHNLHAYWENHYYVTNTDTTQNFFGCTAPSTQQVTLTGLPSGLYYHITWFPTRMNDTIHPADAIDTSQTGTVLLDLSSAPLGDTANLYLDTLHADYAFIISPQPVHRDMPVAGGDGEPEVRASDWGYSLYPNPTRDRLNIVLPDDEPVDIALYDLSGRWLRGWNQMKGPWIPLPIDRLAQGAYYVRVSAGEHSQVKPLIIQ